MVDNFAEKAISRQHQSKWIQFVSHKCWNKWNDFDSLISAYCPTNCIQYFQPYITSTMFSDFKCPILHTSNKYLGKKSYKIFRIFQEKWIKIPLA